MPEASPPSESRVPPAGQRWPAADASASEDGCTSAASDSDANSPPSKSAIPPAQVTVQPLKPSPRRVRANPPAPPAPSMAEAASIAAAVQQAAAAQSAAVAVAPRPPKAVAPAAASAPATVLSSAAPADADDAELAALWRYASSPTSQAQAPASAAKGLAR